MSSLIHGRVSPVYSGLRGVPGAVAHLRTGRLLVTGVADVTEVTAEWFDEYNGEPLAAETVDTDTPTGGTRFDISADGKDLTIKGLSKTVVARVAAHVANNTVIGIAPAVKCTVSAGVLILRFSKASAVADISLAALPVGETITAIVSYVTSD